MGKRKYRTVAAAVLVGAVLFSPLLCGMSCMEARVERASAVAEAAPGAGDFMGEFVESGVVGCVLTQVVLSMDWSDWADGLNGGNWVWVGVEAAELIGAIEEGWRG